MLCPATIPFQTLVLPLITAHGFWLSLDRKSHERKLIVAGENVLRKGNQCFASYQPSRHRCQPIVKIGRKGYFQWEGGTSTVVVGESRDPSLDHPLIIRLDRADLTGSGACTVVNDRADWISSRMSFTTPGYERVKRRPVISRYRHCSVSHILTDLRLAPLEIVVPIGCWALISHLLQFLGHIPSDMRNLWSATEPRGSSEK